MDWECDPGRRNQERMKLLLAVMCEDTGLSALSSWLLAKRAPGVNEGLGSKGEKDKDELKKGSDGEVR